MKMDAQLSTTDLEQVAGAAQRLERMGFDALWSFENTNNPFISLAFAAMATRRVKVGTNIAVAFARTPMITATAAWDIQRASKGRFLLGLGTQVRAHNERRFSAPFDHPAARVKEVIQCIRAIWDCWQHGTRPAFKGRFYQFTLMIPAFNPGPIAHPAIPIYLAGVKPLMCRTAGEVADGFHVHPFHSVRYLREVVRPQIEAGARTRGKGVADLDLFSTVFAVTGATEAERADSERHARRSLSLYASTPNYRDVMELHGWGAEGEKLSQLARAGEWEQMANGITDPMLDAFTVSAPPDRLGRVLRERYQGLLGRVALYRSVSDSDPEARWRQVVRDVEGAGA